MKRTNWFGPMTPSLSKFVLTTHIATSVGWVGAVGGFLVLSIAGLTSHDAEVVRGAYLSMNLIAQFIIVPLSFAALLSGLVQSLGTHWGLFRHYWVLMKFLLTGSSTMFLLLHQFAAVAKAARLALGGAPGGLPEVGHLGSQLLGDAGFALLVLLAITTLSVYKPWGRTRYGKRKLVELRQAPPERPGSSDVLALADPVDGTAVQGLPLGLRIFIVVTGVLVLTFGVMHHGGHALNHAH